MFSPELVWSQQKWSLVCRSWRRSMRKRLLMVRVAAARARLHSVSPTGRKREGVRETASVWLSPRTHPFYRTGLDRLKWYSKKVTSTSSPPSFSSPNWPDLLQPPLAMAVSALLPHRAASVTDRMDGKTPSGSLLKWLFTVFILICLSFYENILSTFFLFIHLSYFYCD